MRAYQVQVRRGVTATVQLSEADARAMGVYGQYPDEQVPRPEDNLPGPVHKAVMPKAPRGSTRARTT